MKTLYGILALAAFQFAAAQKTIDIREFEELAVSGGIDITLVPSSENKLVIEKGDPEGIEIDTEEGSLAVSSDNDGYVLTVYFNGAIEEIAASSGAEIKSKGTIKSPKIDIAIAAGSELHLDVEADQISSAAASGSELHLSGSSKHFEIAVASGAELDGAGLKTQHSEIVVASGGAATIYVSDSVDAVVASGGELDILGNPEKVNQVVADGGELKVRE